MTSVRMREVEGDQLVERSRSALDGGEVRTEIVAELGEQDRELGLLDGRRQTPPDGIDEHDARASRASRASREALLHGRLVDPRRESSARRRRAGRRRLATGVGGGAGAPGSTSTDEQQRRIGDRARQRAGRVLAVRDRHDAALADRADRRFDPDDAVGGRRADDRAIGLGADGERAPSRAATATAEPLEDPQGLRSRTYGLRVCPPRLLQPLVEAIERKFAHSLKFALPSTTAPAARSRATTSASARARCSASASEPALVAIASAVSMLALTSTGTPCSGPTIVPRGIARRAARAMTSASGLTSMTAPRLGPESSSAAILRRYAW